MRKKSSNSVRFVAAADSEGAGAVWSVSFSCAGALDEQATHRCTAPTTMATANLRFGDDIGSEVDGDVRVLAQVGDQCLGGLALLVAPDLVHDLSAYLIEGR